MKNLPHEKLLKVLEYYIPERASRMVSSAHQSNDRRVYLKALAIRTLLEDKTEVDIEKTAGWRQGLLVFDKDEFSDVFAKLEIWYGVKIIKMPTVELKGRYSGEFQQESLENVMQGMAFTSGFEYEIVGKTIFIH